MKMKRGIGWSRSNPPTISQPAAVPVKNHAENYQNFYRSAAQQLRAAANALDAGNLGRAESSVQNAITTMRYVEDHAQSAFNKARKPRGK